ncbi:hypothetical protein [Tissierella creatinophila]|uniref:Uncharacterized protein n=1 Tax=Tissierella creatinophila DSM 6911 TaxID=1123403 RepID=A0A1U7M3N8_TISCR|nr:hypothetical protein [Tissierella creatinophila]OLS01860.1 hypothetical protein TICRE_22370 [Tissierella creatinophila DSM 6911]
MKIKFKEQQFQIDAVNSVIECFKGQINDMSNFTIDMGKRKNNLSGQKEFIEEKGFKNNDIRLTEEIILKNIKKIQLKNSIPLSDKLEGKYNLTIEMETGERVIIVTGCINALVSRVSGTFIKNNSCIA